jgi:hypothetical protein
MPRACAAGWYASHARGTLRAEVSNACTQHLGNGDYIGFRPGFSSTDPSRAAQRRKCASFNTPITHWGSLMKMTLRYLVLFVTSALMGLSASVATSADAWIARVHSSACMTLGGAPVDSLFGIQNDATSSMTLLCPAHDQTGQQKGTTTGLGVTVFDDTTAGFISAFACGSLVLGRGGACGPAVNTTGTFIGASLLSVSTAGVWIDEGLSTTYGYLFVSLPGRQSTFRSSLQGYQQTGT